MSTSPTKNRGRVSLSPGSMRNQCPSCGLLFGGLTGFDKHRTGAYGTPSGRRCMTPDEMRKVGLRPGPGGYWSRPAPTVSSTTCETAAAA